MKTHLQGKRKILAVLSCLLINISGYAQQQGSVNRVFENPLIFLAFLAVIFLIYRYLDVKKKSRRKK